MYVYVRKHRLFETERIQIIIQHKCVLSKVLLNRMVI